MSRASVVLNVLLVFVVAVLAWALYARTDDGVTPEERMSGESGRPDSPASAIDADTADRLAAQLARIDARLAALETGASRSGTLSSSAPPAASTMPAAEADRRLALLLSGKEMSRQELAMFHVRLAPLPPADQFALSSALSRAINDQRIRLGP